MSHEVMRAALAAIERGEGCALVTVVEVEGSSPASPGQKMLVHAGGRCEGTVGGGAVERQAAEKARAAIAAGRSEICRFDLDPDSEHGIGSLCGGQAVLSIEVFAASLRFLLFGAGHVSEAFSRVAGQLGWAHTVVDARRELLTRERFPAAVELVEEDPARFAGSDRVGAFTHLVIFTHDHALDRAILGALLAREPFGYLGMIGSARKWSETRRSLEAEGIPRERLEAVRCPIGLAIGSRTPAEIAVAIAAEIIKERRSA